jgi:hypothetical protein
MHRLTGNVISYFRLAYVRHKSGLSPAGHLACDIHSRTSSVLNLQSSVRHSPLPSTNVRKPDAWQPAVFPRDGKQLTTSQRVAPYIASNYPRDPASRLQTNSPFSKPSQATPLRKCLPRVPAPSRRPPDPSSSRSRASARASAPTTAVAAAFHAPSCKAAMRTQAATQRYDMI